jgi:hypothetical protein
MAKIVVNVDTESKVMSVFVDGKAVPNVTEVVAYQYLDSKQNPASVDVSMYTNLQEDNGMRKQTSYYICGSDKATKALEGGIEVDRSVAGFVGVSGAYDKLAKDINKFFTK